MNVTSIVTNFISFLLLTGIPSSGQHFGPGAELKKGGIKVNERVVYSQNGYTLIIDIDNSGPHAEMVYFDSTCTVVDVYDGKLGLMVYQGFNFEMALQAVKSDTSKVIMLSVQNAADIRSESPNLVPDWTRKLVNIQYLQLAEGSLEDMEPLLSLPIQHLVLSEIRIKCMGEFVQHLKQLSKLKYLAHSSTFKSEDIVVIKNALPDVQITPIEEYKIKFVAGQIQIDNW